MKQSLIDIETSLFAPGDIERIADLSLSTLRTWRQRGAIHAQAIVGSTNGYHAADVAQLMVLAAASRVGVAPGVLHGHGGASGHVLWHAYDQPEAWTSAEDWQVYMAEKRKNDPARFLVIAPGFIKAASSLDNSWLPAASTVIDMRALGEALVDKAGRPFASLRIHDLVERDGQAFFVNRKTGERVS